MKNQIKIIILILLSISLNVFSQDKIDEENCKSASIQLPADKIVGDLSAITGKLFTDVATLKVNHDAEGKLSVYFEKGEPKILKFTYNNNSVVITKTFEELEKGEEIVYQNKDHPGKAIILKKGEKFKNGDKYSFNLLLRSKKKPEEHKTYPIEFDANATSPKVSYKDSQFKQIVISPGVSFLSWNGTFTGVDFKK